jgi:hypothetical protein
VPCQWCHRPQGKEGKDPREKKKSRTDVIITSRSHRPHREQGSAPPIPKYTVSTEQKVTKEKEKKKKIPREPFALSYLIFTGAPPTPIL